jgi:putative ABC transport system permease protein
MRDRYYSFSKNRLNMLKSYFKTAFRFLVKNKAFSSINIIGLAIGTLCCLYIVLYVADQYSYDRNFKEAKDIYRVNTDMDMSGDKHHNAASSPPIAPAMKKDFSEVAQFTRVIPVNHLGNKQELLRYKEKSLYEKDIMYVDSTFFDIFNFHFSHGNPATALIEPYSIVLSKTTAEKLFGTEDPIGRMISIQDANEAHDYKVNGVIDESLGKSHLEADVYITMNSGGMGSYTLTNNRWAANNYAATYVKLTPGANPGLLESKLPAFLNKYGADQLKSMGMKKQLHLQSVSTIHTTPGYETEIARTVSSSFLYILLLIAGLIQIIACINFMNLSTARASKRAREVGVRKVIGAGRNDLIKQFLGESMLMSFIGVIIALPLLSLALPWLNQITLADIKLTMLSDYRIWLMLVGLVLITGLVAGSYPAFYLSAFKAIKVIKGNFTSHISAAGIRRSLVVFQFVLSIGLVTGIIVIYSQLNYIKNKDLGFEKEQKLVFTFYTEESRNKMQSFAGDLSQLAEISVVSKANNYPSQFVSNDWVYFLAGGNASTGQDIATMYTDENFAKATGIKIISGRDFRKNDTDRVLINETAAKRLGIKPENAPGTTLYPMADPGDPTPNAVIVGVIKDFNFSSLHDDVKPFMLKYNVTRSDISNLIVRTSSTDYKSLLGKIEAMWHRDFPSVPFEYTFLDEEVQKQYQTEATLSQIINAFTGIAVLISCLGLFGLTAFSAEQRKKEIGVRKVLGASVQSIVGLLSKDFLKLVFISILIATPIAWWAMNKWLEGFAYRVTLSWWMFALAGLAAIITALFTVSFQAVKAAVANPVKSLRSE